MSANTPITEIIGHTKNGEAVSMRVTYVVEMGERFRLTNGMRMVFDVEDSARAYARSLCVTELGRPG